MTISDYQTESEPSSIPDVNSQEMEEFLNELQNVSDFSDEVCSLFASIDSKEISVEAPQQSMQLQQKREQELQYMYNEAVNIVKGFDLSNPKASLLLSLAHGYINELFRSETYFSEAHVLKGMVFLNEARLKRLESNKEELNDYGADEVFTELLQNAKKHLKNALDAGSLRKNVINRCLSICLLNLNDFSAAVDILTELIVKKSNDTEIFYDRATCYYWMEKYELAVEDLAICRRLSPDGTKELLLLVRCFLTLGNNDSARNVLDHLIPMFKRRSIGNNIQKLTKVLTVLESMGVEKIFPYYFRLQSWKHYFHGNTQEALLNLSKFLNWHFDDPTSKYCYKSSDIHCAFNEYASWLSKETLDREQLTELSSVYAKVLKFAKSNSRTNTNLLGWVHEQNGFFEEAFELYQSANSMHMSTFEQPLLTSWQGMHRVTQNIFNSYSDSFKSKNFEKANQLLKKVMLQQEEILKIPYLNATKGVNGDNLKVGVEKPTSFSKAFNITGATNYVSNAFNSTNQAVYITPLLQKILMIAPVETQAVSIIYRKILGLFTGCFYEYFEQQYPSLDLFVYYEHFLMNKAVGNSYPKHLPMLQVFLQNIAAAYAKCTVDQSKKIFCAVLDDFLKTCCTIYDYSSINPLTYNIEFGRNSIQRENNKFDTLIANTFPTELQQIIHNNIKSGRCLYAVENNSSLLALRQTKYVMYSFMSVMYQSLKWREKNIESLLYDPSSILKYKNQEIIAYYLDIRIFEVVVYPVVLGFGNTGLFEYSKVVKPGDRGDAMDRLIQILPNDAWEKFNDRNNVLKKPFLENLINYIKNGCEEGMVKPLIVTEMIFEGNVDTSNEYDTSHALNTGITMQSTLKSLKYCQERHSSVKKIPKRLFWKDNKPVTIGIKRGLDAPEDSQPNKKFNNGK